MSASFDVFRVETEEKVTWISATNSLDEAKAIVRESHKKSPHDCLIFVPSTGVKIRLRKDDELA